MKSQTKTILFAILPLVGVLFTSPLVSAADWERDRVTVRVSERDLRSFEAYLDSHWETAQELYRDPDLINNRPYVGKHRALKKWLADHSTAAREIRANPRAFLWRQRGARGHAEHRPPSSGRISERDLRSFEAYLDSDWQTANLLYQNPALINDRRFVRDHSALQDWMEDHSETAAVIQANPDKFLWRQRDTSVQDFLNQLLGATR